jgi:hypothetical protein
MITRSISLVPSNIVKLMEPRAVFAGGLTDGQSLVSTNSAQLGLAIDSRAADAQVN